MPWGWCWGANRAPPTRRFAGKPAPTFVSGQLCLWHLRANALAHTSISRRTNKAVARARHRRDWPETNVGAGLPAKRRAGGARSPRQHINIAVHPAPSQSCVNTRTSRPLTNLCEHPFTQPPLSRTLRDCDSVCRIAESLVKTGFCAVTSCRLAARTGADQSLQSPHRSPLPGQRSSSGDSDVR